MEMGISLWWNVIFVLAVSQGFFFGTVLLIQYFRKGLQSQLILSLFILIFSYILLHNLVYWNELFGEFPNMLFTTGSTRFLLAPFFFLYFKTFITKRLSLKVALHFIPFILVTIIIFPILFQSGATKLEIVQGASRLSNNNFFQVNTIINWLLAMQLIAYPVYILRRTKKLQLSAIDKDDQNKVNQINWLRFLSQLFLVYGLLMFIYFSLIHFEIGGIQKDYYISLVMCIAVYSISYIGLVNPELLEGEKFLTKVGFLKYKNTNLSNEYLNGLVKKLENKMLDDKVFLEADLKLGSLAQELNIPRHHISQALNLKLQKSFHDFVNEYRIEHAKKLLMENPADFNIKTVMYASGFNNRVSFNNNFKKFTGLTASQYLKNKLHQKL